MNLEIYKRIVALAESDLETHGEDYHEDYVDLMGIATLVREGYLKEAYNAAKKLDTYVREGLDETTWNFLLTYA